MASMKIKVAAIKELEDKFGRVTPDKLFSAAQNKKHPLHKEFVWDKNRAWLKYNLDIARTIISSVRVIRTIGDKKISTISYLRDPEATSREQGYVNVANLRTEREAAEEALAYEIAQVQARLERSREVAAVLDLEAEFQQMLDSILRVKTRIRRGRAVSENRVSA